VSTLHHLDPTVAQYASWGPHGWADYFSDCFSEVLSANRTGQEDYFRYTIFRISPCFFSPKRSKTEGRAIVDFQPATTPSKKALCGRHLGGNFAVKDNGQLLACKGGKGGKACPFAHVILKDYTRKGMLARMESIPLNLRALLTPAAKAFSLVTRLEPWLGLACQNLVSIHL
jgi:hypothetical protein